VAGREGWAGDRERGVLLVYDYAAHEIHVVKPLERTGALEIIGARGRTLLVGTHTGVGYLFDIDDLILRDLDGQPVPTTPGPDG
jgi:hypothetical protein